MSVTQSHVRRRSSSCVPNNDRVGIHDGVGPIFSLVIERGDVSPVRQQNGAPLHPTINPETDEECDYWRCYRRDDLPVKHDDGACR